MAKTKSTKKPKGKQKAAAAPAAAPVVEIIDLQQQLERGGNVPALINSVPEHVLHEARELVTP